MRRYGAWAGCPKGRPENPDKCIAEVADGGRSPLFHQCGHNRGHGPDGLYCKQHADRLSAGKWVDVPKEDQ